MQKIKDLCRGKSIAIVGNAESLHCMGKAQEIDAHDIVIRMNKGVMATPEVLSQHLGFKCSIYAFSGVGYVEEDKHCTQRPSISIWMTTRKREQAPSHVEFFPESMWNSLQKDLALLGDLETEKQIRPSTGCMVIYMIFKGVEYERVDIYGFDFWQTKTFYNKKTISPRRSIQPLAEKLLVEDLLSVHNNVEFIQSLGTIARTEEKRQNWFFAGLQFFLRLFSKSINRTDHK